MAEWKYPGSLQDLMLNAKRLSPNVKSPIPKMKEKCRRNNTGCSAYSTPRPSSIDPHAGFTHLRSAPQRTTLCASTSFCTLAPLAAFFSTLPPSFATAAPPPWKSHPLASSLLRSSTKTPVSPLGRHRQCGIAKWRYRVCAVLWRSEVAVQDNEATVCAVRE